MERSGERSLSIFNFKEIHVALALFLTFLTLEAGHRLTYFGPKAIIFPWRYSAQTLTMRNLTQKAMDPRMVWEIKPHLQTHYKGANFSTNSLGFRGPEILMLRPPNGLRMAIVGRSESMGDGVGDGEEYPRVLEKLLREGGAQGLEVFNASVSGYSVYQNIVSYYLKVKPQNPDWVVIPFFLEEWVVPVLKKAETPAEGLADRWLSMSFWTGHFFAPQALREILRVFALQNLSNDWLALAAQYGPQPESISLPHLLERWSGDLLGAGKKVVFLSLPRSLNEFERYKDKVSQNISEWVSKMKGAYFIDLEKELRNQVSQRDAAFLGETHPAPHIHKLVAHRLAEKLKEISPAFRGESSAQ